MHVTGEEKCTAKAGQKDLQSSPLECVAFPVRTCAERSGYVFRGNTEQISLLI